MFHDSSRLRIGLPAAVLLFSSGCATLDWQPSSWQWPSIAANSDSPGTAGWWKKHRRKAEFVPGEGFRVAGFEGYYDQEGRPIKSQVAKIVKQEGDKGLLKQTGVVETVAEMKEQVGLGPDEQMARDAYAAGKDLFQREKYRDAAKQFQRAIARWPDSPLEQEAMFFLAECQFYSDDYPDATESYQALLKKYPNSSYLDQSVRRQFAIARYWEEHHQHKPHWFGTPNVMDNTRPLFDTLGRARKIYEDIRINDPTGPLADDAIMATATSYFVRGRYSDADYHFQLLRDEYPRSEHQFEAHLLGLKCKLQKYQGPDYDGTPLVEAKKILKQLKSQFAGQLDAEQRERLATDQAALNLHLAERDFTQAKYYDNIEHYASAKFYYRRVTEQFPETPLAEESKMRFAALEGKPDRPASFVQPILDRLPESAERKAIAQVPLMQSENPTRVATQPMIEDAAEGGTIRR